MREPATQVSPFTETAPGRPPVRGDLHHPEVPGRHGLVLTHGAGGDRRTPLLVTLAQAFAEVGFHALRCDLPYRQAKSTGPPAPAGAARDRAGLAGAVEAMRGLGPERVVLGGLSYGGRQASMLAADSPELVHALLLLSYPLHPPGRADALRVGHLPRLRMPAVFVHGSRDPFGTPDEMRRALALIPAPTALLVIEGVGHDLSRGRRGAGESHREVAVGALAAVRDLLARDAAEGSWP